MITHPAFELLRKHKEVKPEVENLVLKQNKGRVSTSEMLEIFENGISGKYGKLYSADAQTLMGWVNEYLKEKNSPKNYLVAPLCDVNMPSWETWDWAAETNKCYHAFLNGVSCDYYHPCVYDNLMLENKIEAESYNKYYKIPPDANPEDKFEWDKIIIEVNKAKQKVLRDVFTRFKGYGFNDIFTIRKVA